MTRWYALTIHTRGTSPRVEYALVAEAIKDAHCTEHDDCRQHHELSVACAAAREVKP